MSKQNKTFIYYMTINIFSYCIHFSLCFFVFFSEISACTVSVCERETKAESKMKMQMPRDKLKWGKHRNRYTMHARTYMQANGIVLEHHIHLLLLFFFFWLFVYFCCDYFFSLIMYLHSLTLCHTQNVPVSCLFSYISWFAFTCFRIMRIFAFFCCCCFPLSLSSFRPTILPFISDATLYIFSQYFQSFIRSIMRERACRREKSNLRVDFVFSFHSSFSLSLHRALFVYIDFISWFGDETLANNEPFYFVFSSSTFFLSSFINLLKQKPWPKTIELIWQLLSTHLYKHNKLIRWIYVIKFFFSAFSHVYLASFLVVAVDVVVVVL